VVSGKVLPVSAHASPELAALCREKIVKVAEEEEKVGHVRCTQAREMEISEKRRRVVQLVPGARACVLCGVWRVLCVCIATRPSGMRVLASYGGAELKITIACPLGNHVQTNGTAAKQKKPNEARVRVCVAEGDPK
jgi:hypothetical protein